MCVSTPSAFTRPRFRLARVCLFRRRRKAGFTLVETLVVVAVVALLAALLMPALWTARSLANRTACISNLRQIGQAARMYLQDYGGYPQRLSALAPAYVTDAALYVCPSDAARGHHPGTDRLEGERYLASGVSYDYLPRWSRAQELGWWRPPPMFGEGKWDDLTPLAACQWHWARAFDADWWEDAPNAKGWGLILTAGASVRRIRVEEPVSGFTPDHYR